jgi:hypothetical protein
LRGTDRRGGLVERGETEIEELGAGFRHADVRRLQVAVEDALGVRGRERVGHLQRQREDLVGRHRPLRRRTLQELHDQVVRSDVVQDADVRVVERGDRARLLLEARGLPGVQRLDGDDAAEARVERAVHLAHSPGADAALDFVGTEAGPRRQRHEVEIVYRPTRAAAPSCRAPRDGAPT